MKNYIHKLEKYTKLAREGKNYDEVKSLVKSENPKIEKTELAEIMREVDHEILILQETKSQKSRSLEIMVVGAILFSAGLAVTFYTYSKEGNRFFLAYGAIIAGGAMFFGALMRKK